MKPRTRLYVALCGTVAAVVLVPLIGPRLWKRRPKEPAGSTGHVAIPDRGDSARDPERSDVVNGSNDLKNADGPPLRDPVVETDLKTVEAMLAIPKHEWQAKRVNNIKGESISDCIENLANFDDQSLAMTSLSGILPGSVQGDSIVVTRLARVRRLLEEGRRDPERVIGPFRASFRRALEEYPEAYREFITACKKAEAEGKGALTSSEPSAYDRARARSLSATYVLAELGDHESLPLMVRSFEMGMDPKQMVSPAPQAITLYAMHQLMLSYPEDKLTPEMRGIRQEYLDAAKGVFPEAKTVTATRWNADYSESDPRITMLDPKKRVLRGQPTMEMSIYPVRFADGQDPAAGVRVLIGESGEPVAHCEPPPKRSMDLFLKVKEFSQLAFPKK